MLLKENIENGRKRGGSGRAGAEAEAEAEEESKRKRQRRGSASASASASAAARAAGQSDRLPNVKTEFCGSVEFSTPLLPAAAGPPAPEPQPQS